MWILRLKGLICVFFSSLFRCDMTVTLINDYFTANVKRFLEEDEWVNLFSYSHGVNAHAHSH